MPNFYLRGLGIGVVRLALFVVCFVSVGMLLK